MAAMNEPKPFASLSSSLLARKGQAKPAMRPQGFAGFGLSGGHPHHVHHEDLGWNDMGHEVAVPQPISADIVPIQPEAPAVLRQQDDLARELANDAVPTAPVAPVAALVAGPRKVVRAPAGSKGKAAFTLRLDPDRHLQLRLVCAVEHRSAQQVVVAALDAYLKKQPAAALAGAAATSTPR